MMHVTLGTGHWAHLHNTTWDASLLTFLTNILSLGTGRAKDLLFHLIYLTNCIAVQKWKHSLSSSLFCLQTPPLSSAQTSFEQNPQIRPWSGLRKGLAGLFVVFILYVWVSKYMRVVQKAPNSKALSWMLIISLFRIQYAESCLR